MQQDIRIVQVKVERSDAEAQQDTAEFVYRFSDLRAVIGG